MRQLVALQLSFQAATSAASFLIPILAVELGASPFLVGAIVSGYALSQLLGSVLSGPVADNRGRRRVLQWGLLFSSLGALLHLMAHRPTDLLLARVFFGASAGLVPPALTSLAYDESRKLGRFNSWGSLGFGLGTLAGGIVADHAGVFLLSASALAGAFALSLLVEEPKTPRPRVSFFPKRVILLGFPSYSALLLRHVGATAVWLVLPLEILKRGGDPFWVGTINAVNAIGQFLLLPFTDRFDSKRLIVAGLAFSVLAFGLMGASRTLPHLLLIQPIVAASWAALSVGTLKYVLERTSERATATGFLQGVVQLSSVVGPLVGGVLYSWGGFRENTLFALVLSAVAIPLFLLETRWVESGEGVPLSVASSPRSL